MKKIIPLVVIVGVLFFTAIGCKKKGDPPALPSVNAMTIDLSYFETSKSGAKGVEDNYFELASSFVTTWIPIIETTLSKPITACKALANYSANDAKWVESKTWKWSYTSASSPVEVVAVIGTSDVSWTVTIGDFEWVTGTSNTEGTSGVWNIKESVASPAKILQIDWVVSGSTASSIKYTCSSGEYSGSYMTFTPTATDGDYSSTLTGVHNSSAYSIEWNSTSGIGRMKCQTEFSDNDWRFWNANKENV